MIYGWRESDDEDDPETWDEDKFFGEEQWQEATENGRIYMVVDGLYFHKKNTRKTFERLEKDIESLKETDKKRLADIEALKLQISELSQSLSDILSSEEMKIKK